MPEDKIPLTTPLESPPVSQNFNIQTQSPQQGPKRGKMLLLILITIIILGSAYFGWAFLIKDNIVPPLATPTPTKQFTTTPDLTADWQPYRDVENLDSGVDGNLANLPNLICKENINAEVEKIDKNGFYGGRTNINGCFYDRDTSSLSLRYYGDHRGSCALTISEEMRKQEYSTVDGCLYKNGQRLLKYNLLAYTNPEEFSSEGVKEWFRFTENNKLFIYLIGGAGCGGCIFNGPYIVIDLINGDSQLKYADLPYSPNLDMSPNGKRAVEAEFDALYLFDFRGNKRIRKIYDIPLGASVFDGGHGSGLNADSVKWLDNLSVEIQLYKSKSESEVSIISCNKPEDDFSTECKYEEFSDAFIISVD